VSVRLCHAGPGPVARHVGPAEIHWSFGLVHILHRGPAEDVTMRSPLRFLLSVFVFVSYAGFFPMPDSATASDIVKHVLPRLAVTAAAPSR